MIEKLLRRFGYVKYRGTYLMRIAIDGRTCWDVDLETLKHMIDMEAGYSVHEYRMVQHSELKIVFTRRNS